MSDFKDGLRLVVVLVAYGLTGHLEHDEEMLLEQSLRQQPTAVRSPKCPFPAWEERSVANGTNPSGQSIARGTEVASASSTTGALGALHQALDGDCMPEKP